MFVLFTSNKECLPYHSKRHISGTDKCYDVEYGSLQLNCVRMMTCLIGNRSKAFVLLLNHLAFFLTFSIIWPGPSSAREKTMPIRINAIDSEQVLQITYMYQQNSHMECQHSQLSVDI